MPMMTARNIKRGTFRLSVALAALTAAYGVCEQWAAFAKANSENLKMAFTLECGARRSEEDLRAAVNQYGLFDLSKVFCADRQFLASSEDLQKARSGAIRRELMEAGLRPRFESEYPIAYAVLTLLVVNLLGLAFVALRAAIGWIASGYRPARCEVREIGSSNKAGTDA